MKEIDRNILMASAEVTSPSLWVVNSTLIMTILLGVGLFFFLRASAKDRTETRLYGIPSSLEEAGQQLRTYLQERAYRLLGSDERGIATFGGQATASPFLALFLSGLALAGLVCLSLVVVTIHPDSQGWPWLATAASPLAGWYYVRRSQRVEQVRLRLTEASTPLTQPRVQLSISAHRDELNQMEVALALQPLESLD
ncbi:MAG: cofactor assembly of complex C subunit B [Cyanobacteriota bacterium]|nr:cofactor assembly of complex C subunit B [Cyanobacteriota bacterium]